MKKRLARFLVLAVAVCFVFAFAACGTTSEDDSSSTVTYDVTVVDGTISGTSGWNHDTVEANTSVTVIPLDESSERGEFDHWEVEGSSVSTSSSYEFTVTKDITITAVYDDVVVVNSYDVAVINGSFSDTGYNHDVVSSGTSVTVVADDADSIDQEFSYWSVDGESVSTDSTYTFSVTADTTIMAVYGSNYSVWDGEYPDEEPDGYEEDETSQVIHIASASALAYFGAKFTNSSDATETTNWEYTTFNWGVYVNETSNGAENDDAIEEAMQEDNAWTVSIDCNIDMAGYEWIPIINMTYGLNGMTIDGNNHIIKNFYTVAYTSGEYNAATMKAAGFFGNLYGSDITVKDWTFDGACAEVTGTNYNYQNIGILFGYVNSNTHTTYFGTAQETVIDNVNIINSQILGSTLTRKVGLLIGRLGVAAEDSSIPTQHLTISNCTLSDNYIVASDYVGLMVGHLYSSDVDIMQREQHTIDIYQNIMAGNTVVTSYAGSDSVCTYAPGSIGLWNVYRGSLETTVEYNTYTVVNENGCDYNNITTIDLHCGFGSSSGCPVNTNRAMLNTSLQQTDDEGNYSQTNIFIAADITYTEDNLNYLDWEPNDNQVIYLLCGATVTGLDLGENVRYISGERNSDGDLIVTDADGNEIGAWVITDYSGAYVANN